jgi:hypothetical protein
MCYQACAEPETKPRSPKGACAVQGLVSYIKKIHTKSAITMSSLRPHANSASFRQTGRRFRSKILGQVSRPLALLQRRGTSNIEASKAQAQPRPLQDQSRQIFTSSCEDQNALRCILGRDGVRCEGSFHRGETDLPTHTLSSGEGHHICDHS